MYSHLLPPLYTIITAQKMEMMRSCSMKAICSRRVEPPVDACGVDGRLRLVSAAITLFHYRPRGPFVIKRDNYSFILDIVSIFC